MQHIIYVEMVKVHILVHSSVSYEIRAFLACFSTLDFPLEMRMYVDIPMTKVHPGDEPLQISCLPFIEHEQPFCIEFSKM